jgi:ribonuclease P protein component
VGFIVPKQKHTSVERNRLKRRLRELARTRLLPVLQGVAPMDVVVRTLPEAYGASFDTLEREMGTVVERLRTMKLPVRDALAADAPRAGRTGVRGEKGNP